MRSIRIFAKNMGDPYYELTIVVHDICTEICIHLLVVSYCFAHLLFIVLLLFRGLYKDDCVIIVFVTVVHAIGVLLEYLNSFDTFVYN